MRRPAAVTAVLCSALVALAAPPALADHTSPDARLTPQAAQPSAGAVIEGEGAWSFVGNLGPMQGSDLEFFRQGQRTYVSAGTLGQAPAGTPGFVGQRIVQLTDERGDDIAPTVVADHGSASCEANSSATGLQHDVQAVPAVETELLVDTTDALGRCHDNAGGGLEILDVTGLGQPGFQVREIALLRFNGLSHTVTADRDRPGILYNNGADFGSPTQGQSWTDVIDARSCLGLAGRSLDEKRELCKPVVYRIGYDPSVASKQLPDGSLSEPASCHDITYQDSTLYCAGLNASFLVDVSGLLAADGTVAGSPLPCTVLPGSRTGAQVTDCALRPAGTAANPNAATANAAWEALGKPSATGPVVLGTVNHPGRACPDPSVVTCNTNLAVPSDDGVAVSHEADPTPDGQFMFVTDERGGGVVPPGATCSPGLDNPVGNGGIHVFDVRDPQDIQYALQPDGSKAVFIGSSPTPSPTFCTVHVIEQVPGEQRIIAAYYDGGTKVIDYAIDAQGRWTFDEVASYRLPGANTWASEVYKTVDNADGTRTYWFTSTSFSLGEGSARGIDVFSWTAPPNPIQVPAALKGPARSRDMQGKDRQNKDRQNKRSPEGASKPGTASSDQGPTSGRGAALAGVVDTGTPAVTSGTVTAGSGTTAAGVSGTETDLGQARTVATTSTAGSGDVALLALAMLLLPAAAVVRVLRRRGDAGA